MKKGLVYLVLFVFLIILNQISAGVYFSQPESVYNLGDLIKININIDPVKEIPLKIELVCDGDSTLVYYGVSEENKEITIPLNYFYLKEIKGGDCYFQSDYGEIYKSRGFKISNKLNVRLDIDNLVVNPGDRVNITGTAKRLNGIGINGELNLTIPLLKLIDNKIADNEDNETENNETNETENNETESNEEIKEFNAGNFIGKIENGEFSISFDVPENAPAGDYRIDVYAYEKVEDKITSEGLAIANLKVSQILKEINIAIETQNIDPNQDFKFIPLLTDQTGEQISEEVSIIITNPKEERIYEKIVKSGESSVYKIPANLNAGYYKISASSGELINEKTFYINEKAIVSFEIKNNTLIVTNIGNIPYNKDIEIELNGKPFIRKVELELEKSQEFKLTGDGEYNIKIRDGENEITKSGVSLTGHAVDVKALGNSTLLKTPLVWIFFIIVLGAGVLFFFRNVLKKKSFAYPLEGRIKEKLKKLKRKKEVNLNEKEQGKGTQPLVSPKEAEKVLVLNGQKNKVSIIVLKIKNKLSKISKHNLNLILEKTHGKGVIYESGDYVLIILTPLITRTFKNEIEAAKIAEKITTLLNQYNKKFKEKIEFGIAIGSGDIINKSENEKLKFTSLGSFMNQTKKIAGASSGEILMTKEAFERGSTEIKADKSKINEDEVYKIKRVIDHEENREFINEFLKRMEKK